MEKLFVTGRPRSGKSTLLQNQLVHRGLCPGGYAIQRLQNRGATWAFRLLDLAWEPYSTHLETAKLYDDIAIYQVRPGKWQGDQGVFNGKGRQALLRCLDGSFPLVIMDELGIFEAAALEFQAAVLKVLDSPLPVLGVIKAKPAPFLDRVRGHSQVRVVDLAAATAQVACYLDLLLDTD